MTIFRLILCAFLCCTLTGAEDTEIVLIEDISDQESTPVRQPNQGSTKSTPRTPNKPSSSRSKGGSTKSSKGGVVTVESITADIESIKADLENLRLATSDYGTAYFDADHIETLMKTRQSILSDISATWAAAQRMVKESGNQFAPLANQASALTKPLESLKAKIDNQVTRQVWLMRDTLRLMKYIPKQQRSKALITYMKQKIKKQKPSSRENLQEMQDLQKNVRGSFVTGLTWKQLGELGTFVGAGYAILIVLVLASRTPYGRYLRFKGTVIPLLLCSLIGALPLGFVLGPLIPYLKAIQTGLLVIYTTAAIVGMYQGYMLLDQKITAFFVARGQQRKAAGLKEQISGRKGSGKK